MQTVCIQGLGFVGVAMAVAVAGIKDENERPLYRVFGIELNNANGRKKTENINAGSFPFKCEDDSLMVALKSSVEEGNLTASCDESLYLSADIVIVDINLDISQDKKSVNLEPFKNAMETLGVRINQNTLVIVETTVPPGTCNKIVLPILKKYFINRGLDENKILLAHSYERVMPGKDYLNSIKSSLRVYSAESKEAEERCEAFLNTLINTEKFPLTRLDTTTASETAKVMENAYRAVNIAFIEEWSNFAHGVGVDLFAVIEAIKMRPTHSNMMYPGFGVGGYCLTKDPLFVAISSEEIFHNKIEFPFSQMAVKINDEMPLTSYKALENAIKEMKGKKVIVLGVSYRQDVGDSRYSPTEIFVKQSINDGAIISVHDSYIDHWEEMGMDILSEIPDLSQFDAVIFAVSHKEYKSLDLRSLLKNKDAVILDANNVLTPDQRNFLLSNSFNYISIGRG